MRWRDAEALPDDAKRIGRAVSEVTGVPMAEIFGRDRALRTARARHLVWYILVKKKHNVNRVSQFCGVHWKAVSKGVNRISKGRWLPEISEPIERIKEVLKS